MFCSNRQSTSSQTLGVFDSASRFWRSECGVMSSEFAVVAALMTVLGVTFYETTSTGSRELVSNTGFVIENDDPSYSIDGSGPGIEYTASSGTIDETSTVETVYEGDVPPPAEEL